MRAHFQELKKGVKLQGDEKYEEAFDRIKEFLSHPSPTLVSLATRYSSLSISHEHYNSNGCLAGTED